MSTLTKVLAAFGIVLLSGGYIAFETYRSKTPLELGRLNEPMRTNWYIGCLRSGVTMTTCRCIEKSVLNKMGSSMFYTQSVTSEDIRKFLSECQNGSEGEALKRELQEAMFSDNGEII